MNTLVPGWYVVYTKSRFEKRIADQLTEHRFSVYLPLVTSISQWSGRKKRVEKPLFSSYVFVYLATEADYFRALALSGIVLFVQFGRRPVRILEEEIKRIKLFLDQFSEVQIINSIDLKVGQKRKITFGLFENYECEILRVDSKNKICVRIDSLQQSLLAELHPSHLI